MMGLALKLANLNCISKARLSLALSNMGTRLAKVLNLGVNLQR